MILSEEGTLYPDLEKHNPVFPDGYTTVVHIGELCVESLLRIHIDVYLDRDFLQVDE